MTEHTAIRADLVTRLRESADEVMKFPHPSCCDHLHDAAAVMREAAADLETLRQRAERAEDVIRRAADIMRGGEGVQDQGEAWDKALTLLDAARTAIGETP